MPNEPNLFGDKQLGLGLEDAQPDPTKVDPEEVRQELLALL
jgi:hypothetical protein